MSVQGSISPDNCRLHFPILYIDLHPSCASEEHPGETLRNAVSTHLSRRSSISPHVERRWLNVCVVEARQGRVDWYTGTATGIGILEYRSTTNASIVRVLSKSEEESSVSFSLRFCGRSSSGYFRRLVLSRTYVLISKWTREDRIHYDENEETRKSLSALARRVYAKRVIFSA